VIGTIPKKTIYRLLLYSRCLERPGACQAPTISSQTLAKLAGVKPEQVRKDLAFCGQIGKRGQGYEVGLLRSRLESMLKHASLRPVVIVGVGNLGSALLRYDGFLREGFEIAGAFDLVDGREIVHAGLRVQPMGLLRQFISDHEVRIAILCVPATAAQEVAEQLVSYGIRAILNFAPIVLQVPPEVTVNSVNLAIELESLGYFVQ